MNGHSSPSFAYTWPQPSCADVDPSIWTDVPLDLEVSVLKQPWSEGQGITGDFSSTPGKTVHSPVGSSIVYDSPQVVVRRYSFPAHSPAHSHPQEHQGSQEEPVLSDLESTMYNISMNHKQHQALLESHSKEIEGLKEQMSQMFTEFTKLRVPAAPVSASAPKLAAPPSRISDWTQSEVRKSIVISEDDQDIAVSSYQLTRSMWDAVLLLFFRGISKAEGLILVLGFLLNLSLQMTLVLVIHFDLLEDPFDGMVQRMMDWRVDVGHSDKMFDDTYGKSHMQQLCGGQLWSFEAWQYDEMHSYLYQEVPGYVLSVLAIVVWVFSCMGEYRRIAEQVLALLYLPCDEGAGIATVFNGEQKEFQVLGVEWSHRWAALVVVCVPRLLIVGFLCIDGCQFLAQTASLPEIVLNAMALSFVMDVDEILCRVLLPHKLLNILDRMRPLPAGSPYNPLNKSAGGFFARDIARYGIAVGIIVMAIVRFLMPFHDSIRGASTALCGGRLDFTYKGGTATDPTIVLKNTTGWQPTCDEGMKEKHLAMWYGVKTNKAVKKERKSNLQYKEARTEAVYSFAFKGCGITEVRNPAGVCMPLPGSLKTDLPKGVVPGDFYQPMTCAYLRPALKERACQDSVTNHSVCLWPWRRQICEENAEPPGEVYNKACGGDLWDECDMWDYLGMEHPTKNCLITKVCDHGDAACFYVMALLQLEISEDGQEVWEEKRKSAESAVKKGLAKAGNVTLGSVDLFFSGAADVTGLQNVTFRIQGLSETVNPYAIPTKPVVSVVNEQLFNLNKRALVTSASFSEVFYGNQEVIEKKYTKLKPEETTEEDEAVRRRLLQRQPRGLPALEL